MEPPILDPLFGLFEIPDSAASVALFQSYLERGPGTIAFRERARRLGIYPICYRPSEVGGEVPHVHEFLEMFLVVRGRARHRSGKQSTPLNAGDIVFADHAAPHRFEGETKDFEVVILCFLPSALGYSDALLGDRATMDYYALLVPFSPGEGEPLRLHPEARAFKKIAFLAFQLMELYFREEAPAPGPLGDALRLLLSLIVHEARGRAPSAASAVPFKEVLDLLRARFREKITLGELARRFRMAPTSFSSRFNRVTGRTLPRYVNELRAAEAERLLRETTLPVRRVAFEVGYENVTHFNAVFKRLRGKAPQALRSGASKDSHA